MTDKERYEALCRERGAEIPVFQQHWWMECVCAGKQWDVLLVGQGQRIDGALPYLVGRRIGLRYVVQPELTQFSGPWLAPSLSEEGRLRTLDRLAERLDDLRLHFYLQCFAPGVDNWLPFYWRRYHQTTRYTYRFDPLRPAAELMPLAQPQRRKRLDLLRQECTVDAQVPVEEFVPFHNDYYVRRDGHNLVSPTLVERVCRTALQRGQGLLLGLRDKQGRLLTADFVVYDDRCAHSLLSGMSGAAPRNANSLLFWSIIDELHGRTQAFDFEGSMEQGTGQFFRSFGAQPVQFMKIWRSRMPLLDYLLHV